MLGADGPLAGHGMLTHLPIWMWVPGTFATIAVMPWLVTDRRLGPVARGMVALGLVALVVTVLQLATQQLPGLPANPLHVDLDPWRRTADWLGYWPGRLCLVVGVVAAGHLVLRWRRGPDDERPGLGWLAIGQALLAVSFLPVVFPDVFGPGDPAQVLAHVLAFGLIGAQAFLPAALLVVVLRQRLWGIDAAVSRALAGGLLSAAVVALYLGLVWLGRQVLPWPDEVSGVLAVGLLAVAMLPLRSLIQQRVSHLVYGVSRTPGVLLRDLGEHLSGPAGRATDLHGLVQRLRGGLRLGQVELRAADGAVLASSGEAGSDVLDLQLTADGRPLGELRLAPRAGERLDRRTVRTVEQLGGLVAVAVQLAEANRDLGAARNRLVEVRHEERRLLRRELHDELGPALAGIGLGLAAVRNTVPVADPTDVLLDRLQDELARRTDDVRSMARALLPPALDEGRFEDALQVLASRFDDTGLRVTTSVVAADGLDGRRQVALYHVAAEAVANAHRHARATTCAIEVTVDPDGSALLRVTDDGCGLRPGAGDGVGMHSMRERAIELGGTFEAQPGPQGTTVSMRLP
jgi:signal transduction histidine kinase